MEYLQSTCVIEKGYSSNKAQEYIFNPSITFADPFVEYQKLLLSFLKLLLKSQIPQLSPMLEHLSSIPCVCVCGGALGLQGALTCHANHSFPSPL